MTPIYLDHNATTPVDPRVVAAMEPYWQRCFGNAASETHSFGWEAQGVIKKSRENIADLINAPQGAAVVFTSGTTESNNMVFKGVFFAHRGEKIHIITQKTEHESVLKCCEFLQSFGVEVTLLDVDQHGFIDVAQLEKAIQKNTVLVSIMAANNEIGTIQNLCGISTIVRKHKSILLHTDAAQAVGKIPLDVQEDHIDLMSFSAHKIYGPKGIGALYLSPRVTPPLLSPLLHGGSHEMGWRAGTVNVPGIVGFSKALELCFAEMGSEARRLTTLRDQLIQGLLHQVQHVALNGHPLQRLPGNVNLSFDFCESGALMLAMPGLALSSGSACASGSTESSPVIRALGFDEGRAKTSLRFGLGRFTTPEDIQKTIHLVRTAVEKIRKKSLEYEMFLSQTGR